VTITFEVEDLIHGFFFAVTALQRTEALLKPAGKNRLDQTFQYD